MTMDDKRPDRGEETELKTRVWMNGSLEWFAYLEDERFFLGGREVPYPLKEGDRWTNRFGETFRVENGEILREA